MLMPTPTQQLDDQLSGILSSIPVLEGFIGGCPITNGQHHEVFRLFYPNHPDYIVQSERKDGKTKFTSKVENSIIQANAGIAPPCIFHDDKITVYEFIEGDHPKATDANIIRMADVIKTIQSGPKMKGTYCPIKKMNKLRAKIEMPKHINKYIDQIVKHLKRNTSLVPSHNDLALQNIIDDGKKMYVIDWEFSGQAVKEWDPAFLSVHGHFNVDQDKLLLETLHGKLDYDIWINHKFYKLIFIGMLIAMKVRSGDKKALKAWSALFDRIMVGKY